MQGGDDQPCMPPSYLVEYELNRGRPCPFVALDPANGEAAELVGLLLDERLRGLAPLAVEGAMWMGPDDRRALVARVSSALRRKDVLKVMYPEPKDTK